MAFENFYKTATRRNRYEQVYDQLVEALTASDTHVGKRLAPVKELAAQFGTSVRTVQRAIEQLENEGRVQRRHGVGTFVRQPAPALNVTNPVAAIVGPMGEDVWSTLVSHFVRDLQACGWLPMPLDNSHADTASLLQHAAEDRVGTFIIRGGRSFPFHLLEQPIFRDKQFIAIDEWASTFVPPQMQQVLHDYAYGGQQLAEFLFNRGHRHVVIIAAPDSGKRLTRRDGIACGASRGHAFIDYWTDLGGTWKTLPIHRSSETLSGFDLDLPALLAELTSAEPVTAIFGYRDVEAWTAQSLLQRHRPDLLNRVEIVGYGDTAWSRAAQPPLTTIAYPIQDTAQWVRQLLDTLPSNSRASRSQRIMVRPALIDRSRPQPSGP